MKFFRKRSAANEYSLDFDVNVIKNAFDYGDGPLVKNFTFLEFKIFLWCIVITGKGRIGPQLIRDELDKVCNNYEDFMAWGHEEYIKNLSYLIRFNNVEFGSGNRIFNVTEPLYLILTLKSLGYGVDDIKEFMIRTDGLAKKSGGYEEYWSNFIIYYSSLTDFLKFSREYNVPKRYDEILWELYFKTLSNPSVYNEDSLISERGHNLIVRDLFLNLVSPGGGYNHKLYNSYLLVIRAFLLSGTAGHELINKYLFILFTNRIGYHRAYNLLREDEEIINKLSLNIINYLYNEWDERMPLEWAFELMDDWQVEAKNFMDKI